MIHLPHGWFACERGNTWLTNEGHHILWFNLPDTTQKLQLYINPDNYPSVSLTLLTAEQSTNAYLAKVINEYHYGWLARRCNVAGVFLNEDGVVCDEEEARLERKE